MTHLLTQGTLHGVSCTEWPLMRSAGTGYAQCNTSHWWVGGRIWIGAYHGCEHSRVGL